jgi:hypothetical protein
LRRRQRRTCARPTISSSTGLQRRAALTTSSGRPRVGSTYPFLFRGWVGTGQRSLQIGQGRQHSEPLQVGQEWSALTNLQMGQGWAVLTTSSGGPGVGSTHNLFRWVRGGQHSQTLQVGQGWAALTTSFCGQRWAAFTTYSDGSGMRTTQNSLEVGSTHNRSGYFRDQENMYCTLLHGAKSIF